ncbi:methionyl-tRNA formyltransferase [Comamonas sp. GB3 AK4-5]|uniref:methionyl-tRNA formyltransferase n=1 Tax=Comamonas sp. GB3 AK4-5 TaxID=3231487 RepID=UPI00351E1CFE
MGNELKILLITQGISRIVDPIITSKHEVVGVLESMPRNFSGINSKGIVFEFIKKTYSILSRREISLRRFCAKKNIPYYFIWKKNSSDAAQWIREIAPDLIVVFSMSQLLRRDILSIPPMGAINLHPSYLPSYRGPNPDFWQYCSMELNPGATVHYIDLGEDTGDILFQDRLPIPLGTKSPERLDKLVGGLGVSLLLKSIDAIAEGKVSRLKQSEISPTPRARNLIPEEHANIIDWEHWDIEKIWHILRGTESWLNAIAQPVGFMAGQRWSIDAYEKIQDGIGRPGDIGRYKGRRCLFVRGGVIFLSVKFDPKRVVLKFLNK